MLAHTVRWCVRYKARYESPSCPLVAGVNEEGWDLARVADDLAAVLRAAEAALCLEQAVHGLDARDERALQALLAAGLPPRWEVAREAYYLSSAGKKGSHRLRCDLVLTPPGLPLRGDAAQPSLFEPPQTCEPRDALWLELKVAYQLAASGAQRRDYGARWRRGVTTDLRKMAEEPLIRHAALVLLVFTESQAILDKDLELMEALLVAEGLLAAPLPSAPGEALPTAGVPRQVRTVPLLDRRGHRLLAVALWPSRTASAAL